MTVFRGIELKECVTCGHGMPAIQQSNRCVPCRKATDDNLLNCDGCGLLVDGLSDHVCISIDKRRLQVEVTHR